VFNVIRKASVGLVTGALLISTLSAGPAAQGNLPKPRIPTRLDVVISRFQGEKKVSSLPFTLWVQANDALVSLRMGVDVPVGQTTVTTGQATGPQGGGTTTRTTSETQAKPEYKTVGTNLDCMISSLDDGRFLVRLSVQDSSVFTSDGDKGTGARLENLLAFRTFNMSGVQIAMRDGQTQQFTQAVDKISGETIKVDATLTVVK